VEIDRQRLPEDPKVLQQMVVALLAERDSQEQRLRQVQHLLEQLLRARYGPRRERISEHQLFLFAATILSAQAQTPPASEKSKTGSTPRPGHGRQRLPATLERRRVVYDLGEQERQCPQCQGELSSKVVQTDDTPVPVLDPELPRTRTGRIWAYVGDAEHPYI
jgi:transposase